MTSTAIARHAGTLDVMQLGNVLAKSGYFKDASDPAKAIVKVLYGQEVGIGPVTAMMGIHIIEGKPTMSGNLMASRVKASGKYDYRVKENSAERCVLEFFEYTAKGKESIGLTEWTMEDAKRAKLNERDVWKKYPKAMLFNRALSEGVKAHCPDVFSGASVYTPEELGADIDAEGNMIVTEVAQVVEAAPMASAEQVMAIQAWMENPTITDEERAGIEKRMTDGLTAAKAQTILRWLSDTITERTKAEKADATELVEV